MSLPPFVHLDTELAMAQIGDLETMNSMLLMLQETLRSDISQISDYLEDGNVSAANKLLHALKGFVPIFCGDSLCMRVTAVELMSKDSQNTGVRAAYGSLRPDLETLLRDADAYLSGAQQG